ncbi:hypothetical protein BDW69DRAFT_181278 [Aspergillus filifer]
MDNAPESNPISLPSRSRGDNATSIPHTAQQNVTSYTRSEIAASSAVKPNARKAAAVASKTQVDDDEDDYTSSSGSSLSSSDDEDDDDEATSQPGDAAAATATASTDKNGLPTLPARKKPNIRRLNPQPSILSKLSAFLPQMKSANEDLQREIEAGRGKELRLEEEEGEDKEGGESGGEGKQYIEMNLGLGVLEEKRPGDDDEEFKPAVQSSAGDTDLLDRLMGKEKTDSKEKPNIQDLGE